jgi:signal transduction histidine kinase
MCTESELLELSDLRPLIDLFPHLVIVISGELRLLFANQVGAHLLDAPGPEALLGVALARFLPDDVEPAPLLRVLVDLGAAGQEIVELVSLEGRKLSLQMRAGRVLWRGQPAHLLLAVDVFGQQAAQHAWRLADARLQALLELNQLSSAGFDEIASYTLNAAITLTESEHGYLALTAEDEQHLHMYAWSDEALKHCQLIDRPREYDLDRVGLWGEPLRQKRGVITNDYASENPTKRGLPEGHIELWRHVGVPIMDGERVVAVIGVANKVAPYDDSDIRQLTLLGNEMWRAIERKRAADAEALSAARLEAMHEIDQRILGGCSLPEIAQAVLAQLRRLLPVAWAFVTLPDPTRLDHVIVAAAGDAPPPSSEFEAGGRFPQHDGSAQIPADLGQPEMIDDLAGERRRSAFLDLLEAGGIRTYYCIPLCSGDDAPGGYLSVCGAEPSAFSAAHLAMARELADQLAVAAHQAALRDEVAHHTLELEKRISQRTEALVQANESLRQAVVHSTELDRLKTQFLSNVSHELRTPLTNIKLMASLLGHGKPEKHDHYLATLRSETELLQRLVEDLLDLSRLELGQVQPASLPVDLNDLAKSVAGMREALVSERGLSLTVELAPDLPVVTGDASLLGQVIGNLLTNAMNYTPAGGAIRVGTGLRVLEGKEYATVFVRDTGPGIAPHEQARLHERFFRGEAGLRSGAPGTGLGLSICHEIVQRHDGRITLDSAVGQGSRFTMCLPVADGPQLVPMTLRSTVSLA